MNKEICNTCGELKPPVIHSGTRHWCSFECCDKDPPALWDLPGGKIISVEEVPVGDSRIFARKTITKIDTSGVDPEILAAHEEKWKKCWMTTKKVPD